MTRLVKEMGGVSAIQLGHTGRKGSECAPWLGRVQLPPEHPDGVEPSATDSIETRTRFSVGRVLLLDLSRHSDHHANPGRPYPLLRSFPEAPQFPTGYPGMIVLALFPPAFFAVMHSRLAAWEADRSRAPSGPREGARGAFSEIDVASAPDVVDQPA